MEKEQRKNLAANEAEKYKRLHHTNSRPFKQLDFKAAMGAAGLHTKDPIIQDGRLRRVHIEGDKPGSKNGFYVLYGGGVSAGCFGSWKTGEKYTWCAKATRDLTPPQRKENRRRMIEEQKVREAEEKARRNASRDRALSIWRASSSAPDDHPYLVKKGVGNHGLRLHKSSLVIPIRDSDGNLHSLQFIDGEGNKRFLSGGRKKGCYFAIGVPTESLCIAEGYATGASVHEATGLPVAVAFDAGNLESVAMALRNKFPDLKIILCADNDADTDGNPGLTKAKKAAASIGAYLAVPPCAGDFNDLYTRW